MYFAMELYNSNNWADDVGRAAFENKFYNNWAISRALIGLRESYGRLEYRPWKNLCRFVKCRVVYKFHSSPAIRDRKEQTS